MKRRITLEALGGPWAGKKIRVSSELRDTLTFRVRGFLGFYRNHACRHLEWKEEKR